MTPRGADVRVPGRVLSSRMSVLRRVADAWVPGSACILARLLPARPLLTLMLALPLALPAASLAATGGADAAAGARTQATVRSAPREAELRRAEREAQAALQQWRARLREVEDAAWAVQAPARAAERYAQQQQQAQQATEAARLALAQAQACQPELTGAAQALQAAATAYDEAVAATAAAASGLAQAEAPTLREQVPATQRAFAARREAEQALQRNAQLLRGQARSCGHAAASAQRAVEQAHRATLALGPAASALQAAHAALQQALDYASTLDGGTAAPPGPPLPRLRPPALPGEGTARQLAAAASPLSAVPAPPAAPGNDSPWALLQTAATQQRQGLATLARLTDAAALLGVLADTPPEDCAPVGCPSFDADRSALARGRAGSRAALVEAQRRQIAAVAALGGALQPLQAAQTGIEAAQQALVAPSEAALADARSASQRAAAALAPLEQATRQGTASAQQAWAEAAARLGEDPRRTAAAAPPPPPAAAPPSPLPAMAMPPDLRSHAHTTFTALGGEPEGYGAYTYVLMSSAAALDNRDVKRRLLRVLDTLQQTSARSGLVSAAQRRRVNLFCIPSAAEEDAPAGVMVGRYLGDLGQQALFHTQNALLTQGELARRLSASPGPFLLTLPKRIHESTPDTPLLLADLSRYEEAAIADLVVAYMDGVLDDFPQRQAQWKPALPLSVGLTLVRWVSAPARIVASLIPPATARTDRP